jgi:hypothetical protein
MDQQSAHAAPRIGWLRAILTAAAIVAIGIAICVYGTNAVLTRVHSLNRGNRVAIATTLFFATIVTMAWLLRRLQARHLL